MITKFIEFENVAPDGSPFNWGKFMVARFHDEEWIRSAVVDGRPLLAGRGWTRKHVLIVDLQTGEGAIFLPGGMARADLDKHKVWVCPLFEPFLVWLYEHWDGKTLADLPAKVSLPLSEAPASFQGYRREGLDQTSGNASATTAPRED